MALDRSISYSSRSVARIHSLTGLLYLRNGHLQANYWFFSVYVTGAMCGNLPFCVGEKVRLSESRHAPGDCVSARMQYGIVKSVGIAVENPIASPACIICINCSGTQLTC